MWEPDDLRWFEGLDLRSEPLCRAWIEVDRETSPMDMGEGPWRRLFAAYVKGGRFEGPRLRGRVMPGGGDWPDVSRGDAAMQAVNARVVWRTDDGAWLYLAYGGRIVVSPAVRARIAQEGAERVPASAYYFRAMPVFETADPRYAWLNERVCVAVGRLTATGVAYGVHAIL